MSGIEEEKEVRELAVNRKSLRKKEENEASSCERWPGCVTYSTCIGRSCRLPELDRELAHRQRTSDKNVFGVLRARLAQIRLLYVFSTAAPKRVA